MFVFVVVSVFVVVIEFVGFVRLVGFGIGGGEKESDSTGEASRRAAL